MKQLLFSLTIVFFVWPSTLLAWEGSQNMELGILKRISAEDIVFFEDYESVNWRDHWKPLGNPRYELNGTLERSTLNPFLGSASLKNYNPPDTNTTTPNETDNVLRHTFTSNNGQGYDELYMRWYMKIDDGLYFTSASPAINANLKGNALYGWINDPKFSFGHRIGRNPHLKCLF